MNPLFIPGERRTASTEPPIPDNQDANMSEAPNHDVTYKQEGYQVRVHFNGERTLLQALKNLAERSMED
ncbi:MAG: hypothetical protein ACI4EG_14320 [Fusicatenibacter sp.]|nr:hypothetical protein [Fusicatenibacter sp.]